MRLSEKLAAAADELRAAGDRQMAAEAARGERSTEGVRGGELLAFSAAADWPVQWLLLNDLGDSGRAATLVPADSSPLLGPGDLAVRELSSGAPLSLRCACAILLPAAVVHSAALVGEVPLQNLDGARELVGAEPPLNADELGPEYADWLEEVVLPARAALVARSAEIVPPAVASSPVPWRAAAMLLLGLSVVLTGVLWQAGRSRIADEAVLLELPLVFLAPQEQRGDDPTVLTVASGTPRFAVVLSLDPATLRDSYRLEATRPGEAEALWAAGPVARNGQPWLSLELPSALFPPGEYRLGAYAPGESARPLAEYRFRVEAAAR